jgi:hypothetical protein
MAKPQADASFDQLGAFLFSGYPQSLKSLSQAVGAGPCACPFGAHLAFVDNRIVF